MSTAHNTSISKIAHWDWRVPPADRRNSEVKTYYLSPEELERYRKGGEKKVEETKEYQAEKRTVKQALEEDFATGKKTIEQIAEELGIKPRMVKAAAARMGLIEKKQKPDKADISLVGMAFHGILDYNYREGKFAIRQPNKEGEPAGVVLDFCNIDFLIKELQAVRDKIREVNGE
jgi:hypothetical protein